MTNHDADQVIGRIRKDGGWDRRYHSYRDQLPPPKPEVEPTHATRGDVFAALFGFYVLGILFVVLFILWPILGVR